MDYLKQFGNKCPTIGKRELKMLPEQLNSGEKVIDVVGGMLKKDIGAGTGILVLTDKRVFFLDKGMLTVNVTEHMLSHINNISFKKGVVLGDIVLNVPGSSMQVGSISKQFVQEWVENAKKYIGKPNGESKKSSIDDLEKLAELKKKGVITEKEFQAQKKKILAG